MSRHIQLEAALDRATIVSRRRARENPFADGEGREGVSLRTYTTQFVTSRSGVRVPRVDAEILQ